MSLTRIEAELKQLSPEELRSLALSSWQAFLDRERTERSMNVCDEDDPALLAALDEAVRTADQPAAPRLTAAEVRGRLSDWTTR